MIEVLKKKLQAYESNEEKYNALREHLQLFVLKIIAEHGYFRYLAFVGDTALRILYDLKRFSEDLDFSLIHTNNYQFSDIMQQLEKSIALENLSVSIRYKDKKTVASAFIKFDSLLDTLGLTPHKDKVIMVKFEVDQSPPSGYNTEFSMVNKDLLVGINHYDLPSLFAGKLHALLYRKYAKGRDYYDFIWYAAKKVEPNYTLLNNAILQTEQQNLALNKKKLTSLLLKKFAIINFQSIQKDIEPFLINPHEISYFNKQYFVSLVEKM